MKTNASIIAETELLPHADSLFRFAYHLCHHHSEAEDLVQETYVHAWKSIASFERGSSAKAWLFRILKNIFINAYRREKRRGKRVDYEENTAFQKQFAEAADDGGAKSEKSNDFNEFTEDIFKNPYGDEVTHALKTLTPIYKMVLLLSLEDFKYKEIASILGLELDTVRSRLSRARAEMRKNLETYAAQQGIENMRDNEEDK